MDHDVPLYSSVHALMGLLPPNASPSFCVPAPAKPYLAVDKAPPADHAAGEDISAENPTLPVTAKLPDMIAEPVYGNGSTPPITWEADTAYEADVADVAKDEDTAFEAVPCKEPVNP